MKANTTKCFQNKIEVTKLLFYQTLSICQRSIFAVKSFKHFKHLMSLQSYE